MKLDLWTKGGQFAVKQQDGHRVEPTLCPRDKSIIDNPAQSIVIVLLPQLRHYHIYNTGHAP